MKILVVNGPNLKLLGTREPSIYGRETLESIIGQLRAHGEGQGVVIDHVQSDDEGALVAAIGAARGRYDGIVINPAAYTHTSVAVRDALSACEVPAVEVHVSNTHKRETFRHMSLTAPVCIGQIMGFGGTGYVLALDGLVAYLKQRNGQQK